MIGFKDIEQYVLPSEKKKKRVITGKCWRNHIRVSAAQFKMSDDTTPHQAVKKITV